MLSNVLHPVMEDDIRAICADVDLSVLRNKTIMITGGNGFLAAYLVYTFLYANETQELNCKVIAVCRSRERAEKKFGALSARTDLQLLIADVERMPDLDGDIDYIIHAASQASPKYYGADPVGTLGANITGTKLLLEMAVRKKVKSFLYFSSSEVYGTVDESMIPTSEKDGGYIDISNVRACYAESKRMGEVMCVSWWKQFGVPAKIVRPFHTYGPGMQLDDGRVYADFVASIVKRKDIELNSEGTATRAFCYLADATSAFIKIMLEGEEGEAYNVGDPGGEKSIRGLAEMLTGLFPDKKLKVVRNFVIPEGYIPSKVQRNVPSIDKIKKLGWMPRTSVENGFIRTIKSYL